MDATAKQTRQEGRPRAVSVIGIFWLVVGAVMLVAVVAQPIVASRLQGMSIEEMLPMDQMAGYGFAPEGQALPPQVAGLFEGMLFNIQFAWAFSAVKLVAGSTIVASAVYFLRLKNWGRSTLEVFTWLGLAAFAVLGLFWVYTGYVFATSGFGIGLSIAFAGSALVMLGLVAVPLVIMVRKLRGDEVKNAMVR